MHCKFAFYTSAKFHAHLNSLISPLFDICTAEHVYLFRVLEPILLIISFIPKVFEQQSYL